ncbi:lipoprotein [Pelagibacteraceae bacterium]|nr:lipoprotein [Pelagibacteraceae bacterium]
MKKIFILLGLMFLLAGCVESVAVIGTGAANGKLVQSSINTGISYGIKAQTGKSPMEHAFAYSKKQNLEAKQDSCSSFTNKKNLEICRLVKEKIAAGQKGIKRNKSYLKPSIQITKSLRSSIDKKFEIKYLD